MPNLNRDILYLIFKEFQDDKKTLHSCLLVNKTWCEVIIPIFWNNPWKDLKGKEKLLLNVIILHVSDDDLISQGIDFLINCYQKPLFDYISFCKHLNFDVIWKIIDKDICFGESSRFLIKNEILNLFINRNTKFTHLYISRQFEGQIHQIPGTKYCFSKIEFISCNANINNNVLIGLIEMSESIKEIEIFIEDGNKNYEIDKLIKAPKKLLKIISLLTDYSSSMYSKYNEFL